MKFRPQRGGLSEAMKEVIEIDNLEQLTRHIKHLGYDTSSGKVTVEKYGRGIDGRIGWDTHLVCVDGCPVGYTDGPLS